MPKARQSKSARRQLRLTVPVNDAEKRKAARLAKEEGQSIPELVRQLLAQRFRERRERAVIEKARRENPKLSAPARGLLAKPGDLLSDSSAGGVTKPAGKGTARNGAANRPSRRTTKRPDQRRVVPARSDVARRATRSTKRRGPAN